MEKTWNSSWSKAYNIICETWWSVMAWACIASSGTGLLVFSDDVTKDRSSRKNYEVYRDILSAQIQTNAAKLIGCISVPDTDPEMMAVLSRAANRVGLVWNPPPCPEPSRLDNWFLGVARAGSQPPTPVPFFPEVHEELTGMWKAPFTARYRADGSSSLTTLDGGVAKGYTHIPPVERAVAMQLCPNSTWRGSRLSLPGPVSTRRTLPARLTRPVGKPLPPYTLWRCCRSIRPRHWGTCTRVVMIRKFFRNFVPRRTSRFGRRRLQRGQWVVRCPLWWSRNAISGCV